MSARPRGSWLLRAASLLVPRASRAEWTEEWLAELEALESARAAGLPRPELPDAIPFTLGSIPHALFIRAQEWTVDSILQDLRYAARQLTRSRGFGAVAVATLALGIGANGSIFSLVNALVLRPPAGIDQPDRIVQIARSYETAPRWDNWSVPALRMIGQEADALSGVAGYWGQPFVIGRGTEAEAVIGQVVTGDYFGVLGAKPLLGRLLTAADDTPATEERVVVISHELWVTRFGADPAVLGRAIALGPSSHVVVGITRAEFSGPESLGPRPMLWVPAWQHAESAADMAAAEWGSSWIEAFGRLKDDVSLEQAEAEMSLVSNRLRLASPINEDIQALTAPGLGLAPADRRDLQRLSLILLAISGLLLLLTCTNVATLSLARATARRTEVGVRISLGASSARLTRQLLTEGILLSLVSTAVAIPLVLVSQRVLPVIVPAPVSVSLAPDARVLFFLAMLGVAAGLVFSAAPAWSSSRRDVAAGLRESAPTHNRARARLRDGLVVSQLALSLGLIAGAALLGRSVLNAYAARPGFNPEDVQIGFIDPQPTGRYDESNGRELYSSILAQAAAIPGVTSVTWSNQTPLVGNHSRSTVRPADQPDSQGYEAEYVIAGPSYFETMGIRVLRGRPLGGLGDEPEPVVVVNEALADLFWQGRDPIGQELSIRGRDWRVVGLAEDVQMRSLREPARPGVYYPLSQLYSPSGVLHVKGANAAAPQAIRAAVAAVDPELPVTAIQDLQGALTASMGETRNVAYLVAGFALLALVLASVGLYGVISFGVAQRVREMGIRIALGARPASLVQLVLARGVAITLVGMVAGIGISMLVGRALTSLLFGVEPNDGAALGGAALVLLLVAVLASWVPARRASRVQAAISLRGP